jgi:hypothetical protein
MILVLNSMHNHRVIVLKGHHQRLFPSVFNCLTKHQAMKTYWWSGGTAPHIREIPAMVNQIRSV